MNTIIEKIRAEVERQREEIRPTDTGEMKVVGTPTQLEQGWLNALSWMEKVLDTLQEQPVCEGLEEEIKTRWGILNRSGNDIPFDTFNGIACHFCELGCRRTAEKYDEIEYKRQRAEESVPKDLEEAAKSHRSTAKYGGDINLAMEDSYKKGAKWQKAQSDKELSEKIASAYQLGLADKEKMMMKEAVEGEIINAGYPTKIELNTFYSKFEHGQEVKLIIIKED